MKSKKEFLGMLALVLTLTLGLTFAPAARLRAQAVEKLKVSGTRLTTVSGKNIQLRGVSTHGLAWFPQFVNKAAFQSVKGWGCNAVRLALYPHEYNGYCSGGDKKQLKNLVRQGVSYAKELDMYVIIDWHVLQEKTPKKYKSQALKFFREMAAEYKDCPNVLFEICNEPNGGTTWSTIKSYAKDVISAIRAEGSDAVILVGTPTWSQDVDQAAKSPITGYSNLMYSLHFYAGTHTDWLRDRASAALASGLPIFVSEFGISDASGGGKVNTTEGNKWLTFLDKKGISYMIWSLCNKNETCSLIKSSCHKTSGWSTSDLSKSGKWYVKHLGGKAQAVKPQTTTKAKWVGKKYKMSNGKYAKSRWLKIKGKYYYFDKKGYRKTGWLKLGKKKYYLNSKGVRQTGFKTIKKKKYYFNSKGVMQTGRKKSRANGIPLKQTGS